jgi:hypothetical protein
MSLFVGVNLLIWSADEAHSWSFGAHATCIRDAFVADLRVQVGRSYDYPPEDDPAPPVEN